MSCPYGGCCDPDEDNHMTAVRTETYRCRHCGSAREFQTQLALDGAAAWVSVSPVSCPTGMPRCEPSDAQMSTIDLTQGRLRLGLPTRRKRR